MLEQWADTQMDAPILEEVTFVRSDSTAATQPALAATMDFGSVSPLSDTDLMNRIANGDSQAFTQLVDRHEPTAIALARKILRGSSLAEEAVQEAFLAVWREPTRYLSARGNVQTWLLTIVHHRAVDAVRREGSQFERANNLASEQLVTVGSSSRFEDALIGEISMAEQGRSVREALDDLPPVQHQIITLMYFGGLSQTQISERLSIPLGTVKSRSLLAMRRLRSTLSAMDR